MRLNVSLWRQIYKTLLNKKTWVTKNKLFYSPNCNLEGLIQNVAGIGLETEKLDFSCLGAKDSIRKWANQYENFDAFDIGIDLTSDTSFTLMNVTTFRDKWKISKSSGLSTKVINSFNYTLDIKYEPRFLELPMQDEGLKLIIVVPNETDQLGTLFRKLSNEGLTAALTSIQPLFTDYSKLDTPDIAISSEMAIQFTDDSKPIFGGSSVQYGAVKIDDKGAFIKILTCLSPSQSSHTQRFEQSIKDDKLYFFAIIFKDTPLVTGQYLSESNSASFL